MVFTSMEFLFFFFPVVLLGYWFVPNRIKNYWLLLSSLFFYAWGEPTFVVVMIGSIIFNYCMALFIERFSAKHNKPAKGLFAIAVLGNIGLLFVFKYMNFVTENLHMFFPYTRRLFEQTSFVLPIGISFFTFQALSYVIDVYIGIPAQKNLGYLGLYISFFPQLIAGPIVRYTTVMDEMKHRKVTFDSFSQGMMRFLCGFNKKVLLANILAEVADKAFSLGELSVAMAWLGAICYTLQIYFDFSGYSEMAIGLGRMFGFNFLENFNYPYISKTVTEFWRRWHISLGTWFRDYLYFPLGGSRVRTNKRLVLNLSIVWLATGIWHGANWNFVLWGVLHGLFLIIEKLCLIPEKIEKQKLLQHGYRILTLFIVIIGWVLFRADNLMAGYTYIQAMFGLHGNSFIDAAFRFNFRENFAILVAAIICSMPVINSLKLKISKHSVNKDAIFDGLINIIQVVLFIISISFIVMNTHNPFIYFNF